MIHCGQLIKYISDYNVSQNQSLTAFSNYLTYLCEETQPFSGKVFKNFVFEALSYVHWQQNKNQFTQDLKKFLTAYFKEQSIEVDFSQLTWPTDIQVIELERIEDCLEAINSYLTYTLKEGEKFRLVSTGDKKVTAIILNTDRSITIRQYDKKFTVRSGNLEPLRVNQVIHFGSDLKLNPDHLSLVEIAPFVLCQMKGSMHQTRANLVRGYLFQKFLELKDKPITTYEKLFVYVKKLEQYFLVRESDDYYHELIQQIENSSSLLRMKVENSNENATETLIQAQNSLENIYPDDKILGLLVRELQRLLNETGDPWPNQKANKLNLNLNLKNHQII